MNRQRTLFFITALIIIAGDIVTKYIISSTFRLHEARPVVGEYFRLTYIHNPGAAFGMFPGSRLVLVAISIAAALVVIYIGWRRPSRRGSAFALGLILGGAIGNLIDRIRLGEVVDFIQVGIPPHYFPVFNVADSAVTVGVFWLALGMALTPNEPPPAPVLTEDAFAHVATTRDDS